MQRNEAANLLQLEALLGMGSGDRPEEFAAFGEDLEQRAYHREEARQEGRIELWRRALEQKGVGDKPFVQSVQLELLADPHASPEPLELGPRTGRVALIAYLQRMRAMGVRHVLFNLGRHRRAREVIEELGREVLPLIDDQPA